MSRDHSRGYNTVVLSTSVTWAAASTAGTNQNVDLTLPASLNGDNLYLFLVHMGSTVSALTAIAKVSWTDDSTTVRYSELTRWAVPAGDGAASLVQGALMSTGCRLTLSNDSTGSTGASMTAYVQVRTI